ncbi:MAG: class I SAM-dependent methyltransferase [Candidatus Woesearchaeota archaeon]
MKAIWFKSPFWYDFGMTLIHGSNYKKRFHKVAKIIGENKKILDLGAGPCTLYFSLHKSNEYEGWDLNEDFVKANNKRGIRTRLKNCLDYNDYPDVDVIVLTDVLHHIAPHQSECLKHSLDHAKDKVIVLEPFEDKDKGHGIYWWLRQIRKKTGLEKLLGEYDGINEPEAIEIMPKEKLIEFFKVHGKCQLFSLGREMFAIYENKNKNKNKIIT